LIFNIKKVIFVFHSRIQAFENHEVDAPRGPF